MGGTWWVSSWTGNDTIEDSWWFRKLGWSKKLNRCLYVVDAFTDKPFAGNPAAVCILDEPADERWMKRIASEMNLSETAFLWPVPSGYSLRWLTPTTEVKLCGHATLASAFTLWETGVLRPHDEAVFETLSGTLTCKRGDSFIEMNFPAVVARPCNPPEGLASALGCDLVAVASNGMDYLVEVADESTVRSLKPDMAKLATLPVRGVIVTSRSDSSNYDFVSRFFAPAAGVNEDPVTGSAHCALGPYWRAKLDRESFTAYQASQRGGTVHVGIREDRVLLRGQAVMMSRVELFH